MVDWNEIASQFLTLLLMSFITAAVPIITTVVVKWLRMKAKEIEAQIPADVLAQTKAIARIVVAAAEQAGLTGALAELGMDKKEYAISMGEMLLNQYLGLDLDLDALGDAFWESVLAGLDAAVEAEVAGANYSRLWGEGSALQPAVLSTE